MPTTERVRDPAVEEEFLGAIYKGGELLASGKIVEAREHLEKAHDLDPANEKVQNLLGLTYFKLGLFDRANQVYGKLVNENPTDATLRVNLGLVYLKTNNLEHAIREFKAATDLDPAHKKAHNYLGLVFAQQGEYEKAQGHFVLAGSEQMAEKMGRAISTQSSPSTVVSAEEMQSSPSSVQGVPRQTTQNIVIGEEAKTSSEAGLDSDWGAQLKSPGEEAEASVFPMGEMGEGGSPVEELVVLDAVVDATDDVVETSVPSGPAPAWLTADSAESSMEAAWAATAHEVPAEAQAEVQVPLGAQDPRWEEAAPPVNDAAWSSTELPPVEAIPQSPAADDAAWSAVEAPLPSSVADPSWAGGTTPISNDDAWAGTEAEVPLTNDVSWTEAEAPIPLPGGARGWAGAQSPLPTNPAMSSNDGAWAGAHSALPTSSTASNEVAWAGAQSPLPMSEAAWAEAHNEKLAEPAPEWAPEAQVEENTGPNETDWSDVGTSDTPAPADGWSTAMGPAASWEATPDSDNAQQVAEIERAAHLAATEEPPFIEAHVEPSGPMSAVSITVEEPVEMSRPEVPPGYQALSSMRLMDWGAAGAWAHATGDGPFHVGPEGLAVAVSGEILVRMGGLIAVTGSLTCVPENRRRHGRPTHESFGLGPTQMQRVSGQGMIYLEMTRAAFHAIDLTDQDGVNFDDDGAYIREELVFGFEESVSFENGRLTDSNLFIDLAHLKGNGRVLLELEGTLRSMQIPDGAPMMVPVDRLVGWFGRVTPRLVAFGGRGAIELTGQGYALLGSPGERA